MSSKCHLSLPRLVSTADHAGAEAPILRKERRAETFITWTLSTGTLAPKPPVAGSVTSAWFTSMALRCSPDAVDSQAAVGARTMPGSSGRPSLTVAGREGRSFTLQASP